MPTKTKSKPIQTELAISYSVGVKANLGNYESADVHISRSEKWDVTDTDVDVDTFYEERRSALKTEMDTLIQDEYKEMK